MQGFGGVLGLEGWCAGHGGVLGGVGRAHRAGWEGVRGLGAYRSPGEPTGVARGVGGVWE